MTGLPHIDPKQMESQNERSEESMMGLRICVNPIRIRRTMVERSDGMLLLCTKLSTCGKTPYEKNIRHSISWANNEIFHHSVSIDKKTSQFCSKILEGISVGYALNVGGRLNWRSSRGSRIERQHCIRSLRQKIQRKRSGNPKSWRRIHFPVLTVQCNSLLWTCVLRVLPPTAQTFWRL